MSRVSNLKDYGIDDETDPKLKFNSLISVTVSTVMCLAAKCPIPKPNIETTKLFLRYRTVTDDQGKPPRNVKGLLNVLNHYSGPYDSDTMKESCFGDPSTDQLDVLDLKTFEDGDELDKPSKILEVVNELGLTTEREPSPKKGGKLNVRKNEKKGNKHTGLRLSPSKSTIVSKT